MVMSRVRFWASLFAAAAMAGAPAALAQDGDTAGTEEVSPIDSATAFAQELTDEATIALTNPDADEAEKLNDFQVVLAEGLALEVIGKFMLGETRKTMSEAQLDRYNAVFPDYITRLYADQFADIVGKELQVIDAKAIGARDVIVRTQFPRAGESPIMVDWRVRRLRDGSQKMIDIIVQGVSIMLVKREEFSSFISSNGVDALLDRLEAEAV